LAPDSGNQLFRCHEFCRILRVWQSLQIIFALERILENCEIWWGIFAICFSPAGFMEKRPCFFALGAGAWPLLAPWARFREGGQAANATSGACARSTPPSVRLGSV
jgi:hypothetical protein